MGWTLYEWKKDICYDLKGKIHSAGRHDIQSDVKLHSKGWVWHFENYWGCIFALIFEILMTNWPVLNESINISRQRWHEGVLSERVWILNWRVHIFDFKKRDVVFGGYVVWFMNYLIQELINSLKIYFFHILTLPSPYFLFLTFYR